MRRCLVGKGLKSRYTEQGGMYTPTPSPATTHHISHLLEILDLITSEADLSSARDTLTSLYISSHGFPFSWQEGVAKAGRQGVRCRR